MKLSITQKVFFLTNTVIMIVFTIFGTVAVIYQKRYLLNHLDEKAGAIIQYVASESEYPLLVKDQEKLYKIAIRAMEQKDLVNIKITDIKGNVYVDVGDEILENTKEYILPISIRKVLNKEPSDDLPLRGILKIKPERIGILKTRFSLNSINKMIRKTQETLVLFFLLMAGVVLLSVFISIKRFIIKPIKILLHGTEKIAQGLLYYKVEVNSKDEIGELANAFNKMANDLNEYQSKLLYHEKLATIGLLASSVGHELRNPLASIKNVSYYLKNYLKIPDPRAKEFLYMLSKEVDTANKIITDLLDFSRVKQLNKVYFSLITMIDETLKDIGENEKVKIILNISPDIKDVYADKEKLKQVFINLITNSYQAIANKGELKIEANINNNLLKIIFSDTGIGINKEIIGHIFEPLFTTKAKGIGLGLAIANDIIEKHNGKITVESEEEKGAIFTIFLPVEET